MKKLLLLTGLTTTFACGHSDADLQAALDKQKAELSAANQAQLDKIQDSVKECQDALAIAQDPDKDGVLASADKCPKQYGKGEDGCPLDTDGDGIIDGRDKCKDKPETVNGYKDRDGCPDTVPKKLKKFTGAIRGITFKVNSAVIERKSFKTLNEAASVLKEFKDLKVTIEGHTDSDGSDESNKDLSQRRAESVMKYLVDKGIDAARLSAIGFGEDKPTATNDTVAGKAENRRIEFKLVD